MRALLIGFVWALGLFSVSGFTASDAQTPKPATIEDFFNCDRQEDPRCAGFFDSAGFIDYTGRTSEAQDPALDNAAPFQFRFLAERSVNFIKRGLTPIAILLLAIGGIQVVMKEDEESLEQAKNQFLSLGIGFLVLSFGAQIVDVLFFGPQGEILSSNAETATFGERIATQIRGLFRWGSTFIVGVSVFFLVLGGVRIMLSSAEGEALEQAKNQVIYSLLGIFLALTGEVIFRILTDSEGRVAVPSIDGIIIFVGGWLNFALSIVAVLAVFSIIYAGIRMVTALGDEEVRAQAQRIVTGAIIALVLSMSAYTIIRFFSSVFE